MSDNLQDKKNENKGKDNEGNQSKVEKNKEENQSTVENKEKDNEGNQSTAENKEGNQSTAETTPEAAKKQEIVSDLIANNPINPPVESEQEEPRAFTKKNVIEEVEFGWFNLNTYLDYQLSNFSDTLKCIGECLIITFLFMVFPITLLFLKKGKNQGIQVLKGIFNEGIRKDPVDNFVQIYVFITSIYVLNAIVTLISDNILYICLSILEIFNVTVNEFTIQFLQIIKATNYYWRTSLICFLIYLAHNFLFYEYEWFSRSTQTDHIVMTFLIWYGIWMFVLFVEKFFLTFCTSEIRRREYRGRIWDVNYKTFVFKKLVALSKADPSDRKSLAEDMVNDFDPGFYIKHNDIKLGSREDAINLVESIFAYFEIQNLTYEDIKNYFPENPEEVYEYLAAKKLSDDKNKKIDHLTFERIEDEAILLQQERTDMMRTLIDRESIFDKLDLILMSAGTYGCLLLLLVLFGIPYQIYLASIGPVFFTFSWIFSDTIKEIYNCFVFLLVKHPYDVGDRVVIDDKEYVVSKTDVLASTFIDGNGKTVYIPTPVLFSKTICNMRRSRRQSESLTLLIGKETKFTQALSLRDKLKKELLEKKHSFTGEVTIRSFEVTGGDIALVLVIQHTSNFQQVSEKLKRREVCTEIVQKCLSSCGIKYNNSFGYTD